MLPGISEIKTIISAYAAAHTDEKIDEINKFVNSCTADEHLYDRKNFNGHITTSALVIDNDDRMLFIIHAVFDKLLPPGGHVEKGDQSLKAASMRETEEETGVTSADLVYVPANAAFPELPFDINSHPIPEHPKKKEPPHVHHDMRYVYRYTGHGKIKPDKEETKGAKWLSIHELENVSDLFIVVDKLRSLQKNNQ